MAISNGFGITHSGPVVLDTIFGQWPAIGNLAPEDIISMYICCSGSSGTLVYENGSGQAQVTFIATGQNKQVFCRRILTNATINGTPYATSATGLYWDSSPGP